MAQWSATVDVPDNLQVVLRDAICSELRYSPTIDDGNGNQIPNPETKAEFVQRHANFALRNWLRLLFRRNKVGPLEIAPENNIDIQAN